MSKPVAWLIRNWEGYEDDATNSETTAALARVNGAEVTPLCLASERDELIGALKAFDAARAFIVKAES